MRDRNRGIYQAGVLRALAEAGVKIVSLPATARASRMPCARPSTATMSVGGVGPVDDRRSDAPIAGARLRFGALGLGLATALLLSPFDPGAGFFLASQIPRCSMPNAPAWLMVQYQELFGPFSRRFCRP